MKKLRNILFIIALLVFCSVCGIYVSRGLSACRAEKLKNDLRENYYPSTTASAEAAEFKVAGIWKTARKALEAKKADAAPAAAEPEATAEPAPADTAETEPETENTEEAVTEEETLPKIHKDFQKLYELNSDIVGWLTAGEYIDYPVVQRDNEYYLDYSFTRQPDSNGTLFLNECNSLIPRDDVLLIHGHHIASGAMFGKLEKYESYKYAAEHPIVTFRTVYDEEDVYYTPISVFNASMIPESSEYFDVTQILFEDDDPQDENIEGRQSKAFQAYLDELAKWSLWQPKTDVNVNDKLLMLITCSYYQDDGRLMVVCRALRDGETPESIQSLYAPETEAK